MLTLKTNSLMMTILVTLSTMTYVDYFSAKSCDISSPAYLTTTQECHSNQNIVMDFQPSFPH